MVGKEKNRREKEEVEAGRAEVDFLYLGGE